MIGILGRQGRDRVIRQHHPDRSTVQVGEPGAQVPIGPDTFTLIAGPCAVESAQQTLEAAEMAKYAAAEAACHAADRAVQTHGGNGITQEYGVAGLLVAARAGRIAPVSREMILNFVGMHSLGLPKSY